MANREYKDLRIHADRIEGCLLALGVDSLVVMNESAKVTRYVGKYQNKEVFLRVFEKDKGTTLGFSTGKDRAVFDLIAREIVDKCSYGGKPSINISIPNVPNEIVQQLAEYLEASGATQFAHEASPLKDLKRWKGPRSDKVAVAHYRTGTLTVQGINAHVASLVMDALRVLMPTSDFLTIDLQSFEVPLTLDQARTQAAARLPSAHDWLNEPVRRMFSSSYSMAQTPQILEDYCGLVAPAMRGLEGFIKQVYCLSGKVPEEKIMIGEWFEAQGTRWVMRPVPAMHVGALHAQILADGYAMFYAERHTLSHMGFDPENSRLIENIDEARAIINRVFDFVDSSCAKIRT